MTRRENFSLSPEAGLSGIGAAAALAFSLLARKNLKPRTILGDLRMRAHLPRYSRTAKKAAIPFGYLGKEAAVLPIAAAAGARLLTDKRKEGTVAILAATVASIGASHLFDRVLQQRTPPPGRHAPADPHFPSGHALHSTALFATAAWVFAREGLIDKKAAASIAAVLALALGFDRLVQDRHWTTDVVAGWLAAIAIASVAATGYEVTKPKRVRRRGSGPQRSGNR
jgi:membrane-associated phospholipid phosphatase